MLHVSKKCSPFLLPAKSNRKLPLLRCVEQREEHTTFGLGNLSEVRPHIIVRTLNTIQFHQMRNQTCSNDIIRSVGQVGRFKVRCILSPKSLSNSIQFHPAFFILCSVMPDQRGVVKTLRCPCCGDLCKWYPHQATRLFRWEPPMIPSSSTPAK